MESLAQELDYARVIVTVFYNDAITARIVALRWLEHVRLDVASGYLVRTRRIPAEHSPLFHRRLIHLRLQEGLQLLVVKV